MKKLHALLHTAENNLGDATLDLRLKVLEKQTGIPGLREIFHKALYAGADMVPVATAASIDENGASQTFTLSASSYITENSRSYGLNLRVTLETPFYNTPVADVFFRASSIGNFNTVGWGQATVNGKVEQARHPQIDAVTKYVQRTI